jgi:polysaccharide biosynthesis protein PslG
LVRSARSKIVLVLGLVALLLVTSVAQARPVPGVVTQTVLDDRDFARMEQGGVETLRFLIRWREVEPEPGRLDWSSTDHVLASAARHGIEVLPIVYGSPAWVAQSELHPPIDDAADRASWRSFLTALVARYGPRGVFWEGSERRAPITRWQIWNEPNFDFYWDPKPAVGEYARLLEISAGAIRSADRDARIMLAGVAAVRSGMPWWRFLRRLYEQPGVKRDFDFVALHPYAPGLRLMRRQIELARRIMATADDSRTPLAITEVGWASAGPASTMVKGPRGQARLLKRTYHLLGGGGHPDWRISDVHWYAWRDSMAVEAYCSFCQHAGLFDLAGEPKPAWRAYQQAVRRR